MTDNLKDAPVPGEQGAQEVPLPEGSGGSGGEGSASSGLDVDALVEKLGQVIDDKVDARFKSGKDKRFAKIDEIIKKAGGDPERIRTDLELEEMRDKLEQMASGQGNIGGTVAPKEAPKVDVEADRQKTTEYLAKVKEEYGTVPTHDELAEIISSNPGITLQQYFDKIEIAALKTARQSNPGPGMVSMPPSEADIRTLQEEYDAKKKDLVGQPDALIELKMEYKRKGLDIY
jgi:hypothetical protein